jgi:hypothetical protein
MRYPSSAATAPLFDMQVRVSGRSFIPSARRPWVVSVGVACARYARPVWSVSAGMVEHAFCTVAPS